MINGTVERWIDGLVKSLSLFPFKQVVEPKKHFVCDLGENENDKFHLSEA